MSPIPIASKPARVAEEVLGGQLALEADPVGVDGDHVRVPVAHQLLDGVDREPVGGGHGRPAAQHLQEPGRGPLRLGEDRFVEGAVAGDDVARDLQLVECQFDVAAVVEVRLEAGPVLHHQLAELGQREEAEDVVVGRVEQIALAAGDLSHGDGALHPLLARGPGRGHHPVLAVHGFVDRPEHRRDHGAQPLFDEIQPDIGAPGPLCARAHLAPGVGAPVQFRADLQGLRQRDRPGRDLGHVPLVSRVTRGQLEPSRAHPRTAFHPPPTIKEGYSGSGSRCSPMRRLLYQLPMESNLFRSPGSTGVSGFIVIKHPSEDREPDSRGPGAIGGRFRATRRGTRLTDRPTS